LNFFDGFSKNTQISNFRKICPLADELFHEDKQTDRQTDMTKLLVAFCNFANARLKWVMTLRDAWPLMLARNKWQSVTQLIKKTFCCYRNRASSSVFTSLWPSWIHFTSFHLVFLLSVLMLSLHPGLALGLPKRFMFLSIKVE